MLYIYKIVNNLVNILKSEKQLCALKKLFNCDKPKKLISKKPY